MGEVGLKYSQELFFVSLIIMKIFLTFVFLSMAVNFCKAERVNSISTHTQDCLFCGMVEGVGYLTLKVCGSTDCCLTRTLDSDGIDWMPGSTDTFQGSELAECSNYEIGYPPFSVSLFHDDTDGLTLDWVEVNTLESRARCDVGVNLDAHSYVKSPCYNI